MTITKTGKNQRVRDGITETQVGPFWIPADKASIFRKKASFDKKDQAEVFQILVDKYLTGEVALNV